VHFYVQKRLSQPSSSLNEGPKTCACRPGFNGDGIDSCIEDQVKCVHSGATDKPDVTKLAGQTVVQCRAHCKSQGWAFKSFAVVRVVEYYFFGQI